MAKLTLIKVCLCTVTMLASFSQVMAQRAIHQEIMSPEGRAVFKSVYDGQKSEFGECFKEQQALEVGLIQEGHKLTLNWPVVRDMLKQQSDLNIQCLKVALTQSLDLMDRLPASDRAVYFRSLHPTPAPPPTITLGRPSTKPERN
ncbi:MULTISPECIES: hypothetical protein [unclassified Sphingomonas]|uniref:hypothetical protein n=1 Tax=unclassified Sphingomonas TaxID=196159 RepID=UPI0012E2DAD1|nr:MULTISPECIES: hypothetical protein [unclassified Sphingomonas]MDY0969007.1 hypothetical protein [Sphingomonas sp. CFBP9021]